MTVATRRALLALATAAVLAAPLASCAKKSAPLPPAGVPDTYPRVYPPSAPGEAPSEPGEAPRPPSEPGQAPLRPDEDMPP